MTSAPFRHGRASDGTGPGIASHEDARSDPVWWEVGEAVWLAAQRELRVLATMADRENADASGGPGRPGATADAGTPDVAASPPVVPTGPSGKSREHAAVPGVAGGEHRVEPGAAGMGDSARGVSGAESLPEPVWPPGTGDSGTGPPPAEPHGSESRSGRAGRSMPDLGGGPALERSRAVEKALRPLRRPTDSRTVRLLDEEATAEATADRGIWLPCFRPDRERWLTVTLVVDPGDFMSLWSRTVDGFAAALACSGAFRDVRVCRWASSGPLGVDRLDLAPVVEGVPGRHMALALTDMRANRWVDGSAHRQLARWASTMPVALVSVLPEYLWSRMPSVPRRARLSSPGPATANLHWSQLPDEPAFLWDALDGRAGRDVDAAAMPVPVLELTPEALGGWARFVGNGGPREYVTKVVKVSARSPEVHGARPSTLPSFASAADRVRALRAQLSPTAYHLAQLAAAVPLNLTLLQLLRRRLLPQARSWHIAELLLSDMLYAEPVDLGVPEPARVELEFAQGVREELLSEGTREETALAVKVVFEHLAESVPGSAGATLGRLRDLVQDPSRAARLPLQGVRAWLTPALPALTALDGQHTAAAAELSNRLAADEARPAALTAAQSPSSGLGLPMNAEHTTGSSAATLSDVSSDAESPLLVGVEAFPADADGDPALLEDDGGNVSVSGAQVTPAGTRSIGSQKPPPVWGNVPPRNRAFTGRAQLLEDLHRRLHEGTTAVLPEALQGMGGVGKSQLAVEYVYRHMHEYQVIWWVPSEQPQQIRQVLVDLARRLNLDVGSGEANTTVPAVIEALRIGEPYKNWLLVFDNAEDPDTVREFFPTNGPGRILVTSRNGQWATAARPLEVDVFAREESRELLQLRAPNLDDETADRLAETLGDLPLGIEQAAVWLSETGMPADEYLRLFEEQASELMVSDPPPDYPLSVAAAWNVSLERLQKNHPAALQLLQVCAFFAPEPISRRLLTGVRDAPVPPELAAALRDPIRLGRAIREINRYALARINHSTNTIQLHRLVQRVLINQMPDALKKQMRNGAHRLLVQGDPGEPTAPYQWPQYGELLPHVLYSEAIDSTDPWVRELVLHEIEFMYAWGDHEGARDLAERAYRTWQEADGESNERVLTAAKLYTDALRVLGHYRQAYELDLRTREAMIETLGEDHEATLEITSMLAWDLRMRGDFSGALELDKQMLDTARRLFGPNDLSTLVVAHRHALNLRLIGNFREALELDRDTHRRKVEELGENAGSTLSTLAAIALDLQEAGEYAAARDQQQDVSDRNEYHFGATDPGTIAGFKGLAVAERRAGHHDRALELSTRALTELRARYGDNYPSTLASLLTHAVDVRHSGELERALELSGQAVDGYERLFGAEHPHALAAQVNHAVCLRLLGRSDEARRLNERLKAALEEKLGEDHPNALACATNLSADLYELGEVQASVDLSTHVLERCRDRLGPDHPAALATAVNRCLGLRLLGRTGEAEELRSDTLERYARVLGPEHPATIAAAEDKLANCDIDPMPL